MSARTSPFHVRSDDYYSYPPQDDDDLGALYAGEPIYAARGERGNTMLSALVMLVVLAGSGFLAMKTKPVWERWLPAELAALSPLSTTHMPSPYEHATAAQAPPPVQEQQTAEREIVEAPGAKAGTPVPPAVAENVPPAASSTSDATVSASTQNDAGTDETAAGDAAQASAPLPPPTADPADPYQKRAMAAGLHPGLSQALLKRMSPGDYRNAGVAIKTALAKTGDNETFVWPRDAKNKLALFEVRFVKGAAHDCRRYVVTVTKDRWSTTAPPMEKCGISSPAGRRAS